LLRIGDGLQALGQLRRSLRSVDCRGLKGSGCGVVQPHVLKELHHTISQSRSDIIEVANANNHAPHRPFTQKWTTLLT
jgi:hypothetical protein